MQEDDATARCFHNHLLWAPRIDLHYAIIKRFREAGIEIPYPQRELRWSEQRPKDGDGVGASQPATLDHVH